MGKNYLDLKDLLELFLKCDITKACYETSPAEIYAAFANWYRKKFPKSSNPPTLKAVTNVWRFATESEVIKARTHDEPSHFVYYLLLGRKHGFHWEVAGHLHSTVNRAWKDRKFCEELAFEQYKVAEIHLPVRP